MNLKILFWQICFSLTFFNLVYSQSNYGSIRGTVHDATTNQQLEFVNVSLLNPGNNNVVTGDVSDSRGNFEINNVPFGNYNLKFSMIGYKIKNLSEVVITAQKKNIDLGTILLEPADVKLDEVSVTSNKIMLNNSIDRKVYNVQQDILSKTGSASDLLQNIPSVQVDIDGNVSLRGSTDVMILINGKPSPLMGKTRADVLQQMPASTIEKIEVITNPSAKYKPDGTSGIINIVMKKETASGINGSASASAGFNSRYNGNVLFNYKPGRINLFGSVSIRQDDRYGFSSDYRSQLGAGSILSGFYKNESNSSSRPLSSGINAGFDYDVDNSNSFGISGNYFYRGFNREDNSNYLLNDKNDLTTEDYTRSRADQEFEKEGHVAAYYQHNFPEEDHKLRVDYKASFSPEEEDNHYTNFYRVPSSGFTYDNTLIKQGSNQNQLQVEYSNPLNDNSTFEAGYEGEFNKNDLDFYGSYLDKASNKFVTDLQKTNHFIYNENINAVYGTYSNSMGNFSFLGGLRLEKAFIKSDLVSRDSVLNNDYFNFFPTLHLSYKFSDVFQLQLNYSKRVHRPEGDDLNPFPEYQDPRNIRAGNPNLKPEFTHSIEFGVQWQNEFMTIVPSIFYRSRYNVMTSVTKALNDTTLLTTMENLSNDQSAGFEFVVSGGINGTLTANLSANAFYQQIDASNLGFGSNKSTISWSGNMSFNFNLPYSTLIQINSNYRSRRLSPQGEYDPSFVLNLGVRKDFLDDKLSVFLTVSDLLKTLNRKMSLDTSWLKQNTYGIRDSRIIYFGLTYRFGKPSKKDKDKTLQYDNN